MLFSLAVLLAMTVTVSAGPVAPQEFEFGNNTSIFMCASDVIRVVRGEGKRSESLIAKTLFEPFEFSHESKDGETVLTTENVRVVVNESSGHVRFESPDGKNVVLEESEFDISNGGIKQSWNVETSEGIYGGGEFQNGFMNFNGAPIELVQYNTEAVVPFFVSTKGYGILWDEYSWYVVFEH